MASFPHDPVMNGFLLVGVGVAGYFGTRRFFRARRLGDRRGGTIHLRHVLRVALELEERGYRFYRQAAVAASTPSARDVWQKLSQDEVQHQQVVRRMLKRWRSLAMSPDARNWYERQIQAQGIFARLPPPEGGEDEIARYAVEQEERMADFYAAFEKGFPAVWKRAEVQMLVMAERSHGVLLRQFFSPLFSEPSRGGKDA